MNWEVQKLEKLGWHEFFADQCSEMEHLLPARVFKQSQDQYYLQGATGELQGQLPGKFRLTAKSLMDYPAVGDWVLVQPLAGEARVIINQLLKRRTCFARGTAGDQQDEQVVAANIDTVFIVVGLDGDFNLNRIERYLLLCWRSGARPIILLNKADLCDDQPDQVKQVAAISKGSPVLTLSASLGEGLDQLTPYLEAGRTVALVGSSGAGKSTIVNRLLGHDRQRTKSVREADSRGRHTTTFRELFALPAGGMIIDTPGMRALHLQADDSSLNEQFADIMDLGMNCRFADCRHDSEPGCAVREAIAEGKLDETRLHSYLRLLTEITQATDRRH